MRNDLRDRVLAFHAMKLPGQPMMMHMGTIDLVNDLWAEIDRLRQHLDPQWFYLEGYEEQCLYSLDEAIDLADLEPGYHVLAVDAATPRPTIWCAVHVSDDDDADERFTFTEHASEEGARAALEAGEVG